MIRIALIGCHSAAADYGQIASRLQGARLAAVVDPQRTLARRTAEALRVPIWATSLEELLDGNADALDAVVIRGTGGSPEAVMAQAAAAGKHVLLDMRLLLLTDSAHAPLDACRSAGVTAMLGQETRLLPSVAEVESCLRSGILGTPGLLRIHDWKPPNVDEPAPIQREQTGVTAAIFQTMLRDVDLANWLFGRLPTEIYAAGHGPPDLAAGQYGYLQVHLGYPDGGMALVDHCLMLPSGADYFSLSLVGSAGAAYADDHHNVHLLYRGGKPTALPADQGKLHHLAQLQEFVHAIETGRPPAITAEDGRKATEVVRAVFRSLESGRAMRLGGGSL